jgi:hypothetical protein
MFQLISDLVESYMEKHFHTEFEKNITADGKRRVYFRGETAKEAKSVLKNNRSPLPFSLTSGEIGLPEVRDATLHAYDRSLPSGYTRSVVSLTSDFKTAEGFGQGEAVMVVVPTKQRIAAVSQHAFIQENDIEKSGSEYEYICGGVHRNDILGMAYHDLDTGELSAFELNPAFTGDMDKLELDEQMKPLIELLPKNDPNAARLLRCIDPSVRYQTHYESLLALNASDHAKKVSEKQERRLSSDSQRFFGSESEYYHSPTTYLSRVKGFRSL